MIAVVHLERPRAAVDEAADMDADWNADRARA